MPTEPSSDTTRLDPAATHPAACRVITGLQDLQRSYDLLLCDVWGVLHNGHRAFPEPAAALTRFRAEGGTVILLTNAPRPNGPVVAQLDELGLPRDAYDAVVTSGDATVALIAARGSAPLHHVGPPRDIALIDEVHRLTGLRPMSARVDEADYVLCTGLFNDAVETAEDYADLFACMRRRNLSMICANPDLVVHVGERLIPCAGALGKAYAALGGEVLYAGKPHAPIYDVALAIAARLKGQKVDRTRVLAIGDGLPTDIAGAAGQNLASLFVTSGIHRDETLRPDGSVDPVALDAFLANVPHRPSAAIAALRW